MRIDRIFTDLLSWINSIGWWHEQQIKNRPYERLQTWRLAGRGMLHKVVRPPALCPRDCGTYIFEPFRHGKGVVLSDIHLACDHLDGMARPKSAEKRRRMTHRITVLRAKHFPDADGRYDVEEVFSHDDDLQGQQQRRDFFVPCILHQLALSIDGDRPLDWLRLLDDAKKYCMRSNYTHTITLPKDPANVVVAYPLDGGNPVRVHLPRE
jgi:hypothetical protein